MESDDEPSLVHVKRLGDQIGRPPPRLKCWHDRTNGLEHMTDYQLIVNESTLNSARTILLILLCMYKTDHRSTFKTKHWGAYENSIENKDSKD